MRDANVPAAESLESRTLFSAATALAQLQTAIAKFQTDSINCNTLINKDVQKIKSDQVLPPANLGPLQAKLTTDLAAVRSAIGVDRGNLRTALSGDRIAVNAARIVVRQAVVNHSANLAAAKNTFAAAQAKLAADRSTFGSTLIADYNAGSSVVAADRQAIFTARMTSGGNATVLQDRQTLITDRLNCISEIYADRQAIVADKVAFILARRGG